jgi:RimJ/RimL family protein N-acetyltransferase
MLTFRPHAIGDIKLRVKWLNNPKIFKFLSDKPVKTTLVKQKKWFADYLKSIDKKFFTILVDEKPIGMMGLSDIDKVIKKAEVFIWIGEDEYRGRGFGEQAMKYLIDYAFKKLQLRKLTLGVFEFNKHAVQVYKKLGFKIEGRLRDNCIFNGKFYDDFLMALFNENFQKK